MGVTLSTLLLIQTTWPGTLCGEEKKAAEKVEEEVVESGGVGGFHAGVLEVAGTTSFSISYVTESETGRQDTHLRVTPSLGYFIVDGVEASLYFSYIMDISHIAAGNNDYSHKYLFALGPTFNLYSFHEMYVPYAGFLFGMNYQNISNQSGATPYSRSDVQIALGVVAGIRWMFTENLGVKAGLQYIHGFKEAYIGNTDFLGFEIGMSIHFPTWPAY